MTIRKQAELGARALMVLVAFAVFVAGIVVAQIRFGGPIHRQVALQDELLADILPPPAFIVEPYLHTTLALAGEASVALTQTELAEAREEFEARKLYWRQSELPEDLRPQFDATVRTADAFWRAVDTRFMPALRAGDLAAATRVHRTMLAPAFRLQHDQIAKLVDMSRSYRENLMARDVIIVGVSVAVIALLAALMVGAVFWSGRLIRQRIVEPLAETADAMHRMADGDFDTKVIGLDRKDEIGLMAQAMEVFRDAGVAKREADREQREVVSSLSVGLEKLARQDLEYRIGDDFPESYRALRDNFNEALEALAKVLGSVRVGAASVMSSISEIRTASDDLARRNEQQAASLEETAAAMNEVTGTVQETARSAVAVQQTIAVAHQQATEGGDVVRRAVEAMAAIERSSREISEIINVIDGIAFQTNLLALNAGVEAARAGDAGKGFAVVANEVRALAQRSADAAQHIKSLITTSSGQVDAGVALVGQSGVKLGEIVEQVGEINMLIADIAGTSGRQAGNLRQINDAVGEMDRMTQQNAAMVEQSTAATRSLEAEARRLAELVSTFRTRNVGERPGKIGSPERMRRVSAIDQDAQPSVSPARGRGTAVRSSSPPTRGNLALAVDADDDWAEF